MSIFDCFKPRPTGVQLRAHRAEMWVPAGEQNFDATSIMYQFSVGDGIYISGHLALARVNFTIPALPFLRWAVYSAIAVFPRPVHGQSVHEVVVPFGASVLDARDAIEASWKGAA